MASVRRETLLLVLGDLILMTFALFAALTLRALAFPSPAYFLEHLAAFVVVFAISLLIFFIAGLYEHQTRLVKRVLGARVLGAQAANTLIAAVLFFLLPLTIAPKTILALYLLISVAFISSWRFFIVPYFSIARRERALLIGTGDAVSHVFKEVNENGNYYVEFIRHVDTSVTHAEPLTEIIKQGVRDGATRIVLDTRDARVRTELPTLYTWMLSGLSFSEFSSFYEELFDRVPLAHVDHAWLLECLPKQRFAYEVAKRVFDFTGALLGSVVALPFVIIASILLLPGGNPFIFHDRIGRAGRVFRIVKLRTMFFNDHGDPHLQQKNRVTRIGKILRMTRIDELPQLFNILRGELSFIGPRPELPQIAGIYEKEIPYYHVRHLITPGLSWWAQIRDYDAPRGAADVGKTARKLSYDLYYLKHRSFGLDLAIALKTLRALASLSGV